MKIKSILIAIVAVLILVGIVRLIVFGVNSSKDYKERLISEMKDLKL